jgi:hypothetical protein
VVLGEGAQPEPLDDSSLDAGSGPTGSGLKLNERRDALHDLHLGTRLRHPNTRLPFEEVWHQTSMLREQRETMPALIDQYLRTPAEPSPPPIKEPPNPPENPDAPVSEPDPDDPGQI